MAKKPMKMAAKGGKGLPAFLKSSKGAAFPKGGKGMMSSTPAAKGKK
jgi:hypothetical protein